MRQPKTGASPDRRLDRDLHKGVVLLVLGGAAVTFLGILFLVPSVRSAASATCSAEGTIVGHDRVETDEAVYFYPRVAFVVGGTEWVVRGLIGHMRPHPRVGALRRVFFPPGEPQAAQMSRFAGVWVSLWLILFGIVMATVAIGVWLQD
jgi:hypothetical protein